MRTIGPATSLTSADRIAILVRDWRTQLALIEDPRDLTDLAEKIEFIRAAAAKAGAARNNLNEICAVLWEVIRKGGMASRDVPRSEGPRLAGRNAFGLTSYKAETVSNPSAKDLGYYTPQQRERWETCAALPDIEVDHLKDKILSTRDGILTQAALLSAAKQWCRELDHEQKSADAGEGCTVEDLNLLIQAGKTFGAIYADPPWQFKVYSGKGKSRSAERHYIPDGETGESTMSLDDIKAMPIPELAADDCALFLWAVMPELPGALEVMKAWGFVYKTAAFVWVKQNENDSGLHWGMGYWTRANAEICLLGTRGAPQRVARDVHQIIMSPVGAHSRKPEETSARIERLVGGPYLELFARRPMKGWTVWGNDITRNLFHQSIPHTEAAQ